MNFIKRYLYYFHLDVLCQDEAGLFFVLPGASHWLDEFFNSDNDKINKFNESLILISLYEMHDIGVYCVNDYTREYFKICQFLEAPIRIIGNSSDPGNLFIDLTSDEIMEISAQYGGWHEIAEISRWEKFNNLNWICFKYGNHYLAPHILIHRGMIAIAAIEDSQLDQDAVGVTTPQSDSSTECHTGLASKHGQNPAGILPSPRDPISRNPQKP